MSIEKIDPRVGQVSISEEELKKNPDLPEKAIEANKTFKKKGEKKKSKEAIKSLENAFISATYDAPPREEVSNEINLFEGRSLNEKIKMLVGKLKEIQTTKNTIINDSVLNNKTIGEIDSYLNSLTDTDKFDQTIELTASELNKIKIELENANNNLGLAA